MKDATGREIRVGDIVHIPINRMVECIVTQIHDSPLITPEGQMPPRVVIQPSPFMNISQDGVTHRNIYVVGNIEDDAKVDGKPMSKSSKLVTM